MIIQPFLGYPYLAGGVPREFSSLGVQFDVVKDWCTQQLTRHQHGHLAQFLVPALAGYVGKRVIMAGYKIIRLIRCKDFDGFQFSPLTPEPVLAGT
jgi:hypothetical protein